VPGQRLTFHDRQVIENCYGQGHSFEEIGRVLNRPRSTIWREVKRNNSCRWGTKSGRPRPEPGRRAPGYQWGYDANRAQKLSQQRSRRPKERKLTPGADLCTLTVDKLRSKWSPEQIAHWLVEEYPDQPELRVSHETIYQAIYLQGRGGLRAELKQALRTGRAARRPQGRAARSSRAWVPPHLMISERPAEVADRAVPGHWEGDLVIGARGTSAIATLVERQTRYVMLVCLSPGDRNAETVCDAITAKMLTLPEHLRRSLTWDQGPELAAHAKFSIATNAPVYFCDPHSPWQRGSNENTNGLLRQYFPKGSFDFRTVTQGDLDAVAHELNTRPRMTLNWQTPAHTLNRLLVATST
jgi:transposase, IS30 family